MPRPQTLMVHIYSIGIFMGNERFRLLERRSTGCDCPTLIGNKKTVTGIASSSSSMPSRALVPAHDNSFLNGVRTKLLDNRAWRIDHGQQADKQRRYPNSQSHSAHRWPFPKYDQEE